MRRGDRKGSLDFAPMRPVLALTCGLAVLVAPLAPASLAAQDWNSEAASALARRATLRRERTAADSTLRDYTAQAHGFLFFLGQFGEGLTEPPRLVKADQLELEVYWKAPGLSKQRIIGWRDRAELPTDINYHRDHLGIVQNNFGRAVRLGDGDEVRDVPHPLASGGEGLYDFALGDTITLALPERSVRVAALVVRPKDFGQPRLVGTLYVDVETADLVRLQFNFTPAAYLDPQLEDVSIVLGNALWEGRFWLPYRQEIEIRRRATWLDIPARGIIRGRWEIGGYAFNVGLADAWFAGEEIVSLPKAQRDSFPWTGSLAAAIQDVAEPVRQNDLEAIRTEVGRIAGRRALSGLKAQRLGVRGLSDVVHSNRVEGLATGAGLVWRVPGDRLELRALGSYGFADRRAKGVLTLTWAGVEIAGYRRVRDVADAPVIAPFLNSLASQEFGDDYGDYYLATGVGVALHRALGVRAEWRVTAARERVASLAVRTEPATGRFRPNPALGAGDLWVTSLTLRRRSEGFAVRRDLGAEVTLEGGRVDGAPAYGRASAAAHLLVPVGATRVLARVQGGVAGGDGVPRHRAFVLGGRATLLGDDFRAWGGRSAALAHVEWRVPVPFVRMAAGPYARTPGTITLAPYVAAGWADRPVAGTPWRATPGARTTLGLGVEWLGVFRLELGYGAQSRRGSVAFDVSRDFWEIL
jgi:hypothetical protein